jgi:ribosomal protein L32
MGMGDRVQEGDAMSGCDSCVGTKIVSHLCEDCVQEEEEQVAALRARVVKLESALQLLADGELRLLHNIVEHCQEALVKP